MSGTVRPAAQRGFTLVELLVALTLVGLIVSLLFGGIRLGNRSWDSTEQHTGRSAEMRLVWRFLGQQMGQARLVIIDDERLERKPVFSGLAAGVELVAPAPAHLGLGGLQLVRIQIRQGDESNQLLLTRWLYDPDVLAGGDGVPAWRPLHQAGVDSISPEGADEQRSVYSQTVLVDDLESVDISYFGPSGRSGERQWNEEWLEQEQLPQLVKIRITDRRGDWPEMVWALAAGTGGDAMGNNNPFRAIVGGEG